VARVRTRHRTGIIAILAAVGLTVNAAPVGADTGLTLECQAPFTITEGFAAQDGPYVDGKAITATASGGDGDLEFTVAAVAPEPAAGDVSVTDVDGNVAEVRFSDDVPGLDPVDTDGQYTVTIEAADGTGDSADCTVDVRVVPVLDIGTLRGVVPDDANGRQHVSPYALGTPIFQPGDPIAVRGVVTQRTMEENADGNFDFEGFFIQSLDADPAVIDGFADGDPVFADGDHRTSDELADAVGDSAILSFSGAEASKAASFNIGKETPAINVCSRVLAGNGVDERHPKGKVDELLLGFRHVTLGEAWPTFAAPSKRSTTQCATGANVPSPIPC
jgi:hypothetical protein